MPDQRISERTYPSGRRVVTVRGLKPDEHILIVNSDERILSVRSACYYSLGQPLDDVVSGDIIADARRVFWCSIEQGWKRA